MRRCVIVGGAELGRPEEIRAYLRGDDFLICCDSGLRHESALGRAPDLIVGDFDSHDDPHAAIETIVLPHVKDDTDSCFAAKEGLRRGFRDFLLLGVAGARLDHTLGNLAVALMLEEAGARALIVDAYSEMEFVSDEADVSDAFAYFSLLPYGGAAEGVTITGAQQRAPARRDGAYPRGRGQAAARAREKRIKHVQNKKTLRPLGRSVLPAFCF